MTTPATPSTWSWLGRRDPQVTSEIAETLGLHPNTVRPHLDRMREVGLLEVTTDARGEVGRPQHRYSLVPDAPSLGLEPPTMPMLARMVLAMARRLGANRPMRSPSARQKAPTAPPATTAAPSALEALVADLDRLGFDPVVTGDDDVVDDPADDDAGDRRRGVRQLPVRRPRPRPSRSRVRPAPRLVTGFVAQMGDAEVTEFCPLASRTPCRVALTTR